RLHRPGHPRPQPAPLSPADPVLVLLPGRDPVAAATAALRGHDPADPAVPGGSVVAAAPSVRSVEQPGRLVRARPAAAGALLPGRGPPARRAPRHTGPQGGPPAGSPGPPGAGPAGERGGVPAEPEPLPGVHAADRAVPEPVGAGGAAGQGVQLPLL